ncbi:MAG: hypothetical protein ACJAVI_003224 [Candidatus Azotimanducaceae bacterium]|jgi:hypothetical protein
MDKNLSINPCDLNERNQTMSDVPVYMIANIVPNDDPTEKYFLPS